ncbi:MAG: thioredoxin domain-containing protein [Deltaproteobacteria bacterium]|nr:thioredoxin domain-containing protein [Deltaproteobacteria bacterium]
MKRLPMRKGTGLPALVIALCAVGVVVSAMSTIDHVAFQIRDGANGGLCAAIAGSDCSAAHSNPASELLGLPISLLGGAFYLGVAVMALLAWMAGRGRTPSIPRSFVWAPTALVALSVVSLGYSAWLASILVEAGRWCAFCVSLYCVNLGILITGLVWAWPGLRRPSAVAVTGCLAVFAGVFVGALAPAAYAYQAVLSRQLEDAAVRAASKKPRSTPLGDNTWAALEIPETVPSIGSPDAPTTLVEFSDFDCPFCAAMHETIAALFEDEGGLRIRVRFVQFPLDASCNQFVADTVHEDACRVARAAICAQRAGVFWEFAKRAFEGQGNPRTEDLTDIAVGLGADRASFDSCLNAESTGRALARNIQIAHSVGVTATPTTLVNRVRFEGRMSLDQLKETLDRSEVCSCDLLAEVCACDREKTPDCACGMQVVDSAACH